MSRTVSFVISDEMYRNLKHTANTNHQTMSWVLKSCLAGYMEGRFVSEGDLIILQLEQEEARKKALVKIASLNEELAHYAHDGTANLHTKGSPPYRQAYMRNEANAQMRDSLKQEISQLRRLHRLSPGRPRKITS